MSRPYVHRATGAASLAITVTPSGSEWELLALRIHLSGAAAAENLTITLDAAAGAAYDTVVYSKAMSGLTDVLEVFARPIPFNAGDALVIAWANGNSRTYGLELLWR
ncbi:MAG: hypothetical protein HS116_05170 [Planctomycetes bacterium]|nr:hypothetical protein [Planctomycetota bacterium]